MFSFGEYTKMMYPLKWTLSGHKVEIIPASHWIVVDNICCVFRQQGFVIPQQTNSIVNQLKKMTSWEDAMAYLIALYADEYPESLTSDKAYHRIMTHTMDGVPYVVITHKYGHGRVVLDEKARIVNVQESGLDLQYASSMASYYYHDSKPLTEIMANLKVTDGTKIIMWYYHASTDERRETLRMAEIVGELSMDIIQKVHPGHSEVDLHGMV